MLRLGRWNWSPGLNVRRRWLWAGGVLVAILALAYAVAFMLDEPIRRTIERNMNARLDGYTVRLGSADFHPINFALDLNDVTIEQDANPDRPVIYIEQMTGSVQWRALLRGRLVGDILIQRLSLYVNVNHLQREAEDPKPVTERGWQDALQEAYPLTINEIRIVDSDLTYVDRGPFKPLQVSKLNVVIEDIRNIKSEARKYPSPFELNGVVFENGKLQVSGHADFLAEPHPGLRGRVVLENMQLGYFEPITRRYNVVVKGGALDLAGELEYAPTFKAVHVEHVTLRSMNVTYVRTPTTAGAEGAVAQKTVKVAARVADKPEIDIRVDRVEILDSTIAVVNEASSPGYRMFLSNTNLRLEGLTNKSSEPPARATLRGKFMGSGQTEAKLVFRPGQKGGDLELKVAIEDTNMVAMNDLLRTWGKFDVVSGQFAFYAEITVKNGMLAGYVKPLFKNVVAYDPEQDREKSLGRKLYEKVVETGAKLLKNQPRREVATKADLSGRIDNPQTNVWQIVGRLIQNAFFKAIGRGFEGESARS